MYRNWIKWLILVGVSTGFSASAQRTCTTGIRVEGAVTDPTGAVIPGAQVQAASGERTTADATGIYVLPCIPETSTVITAQAEGFANGASRARGHIGNTVHVNVQLAIASVQEDVQVNGDTANESEGGAGTTVLSTQQVRQLPDDPDDLLRELQILASSSGGNPTASTIGVDGFQSSSALPPKSSIASIRITPDSFAPQFQWHRSHVEITTKPGADTFHGALFLTDSNSIFNATDPFSTTATPAGRQQYGFELTGPILLRKLDIALALERRSIDEFNIVNATILDSSDSVSLRLLPIAGHRVP